MLNHKHQLTRYTYRICRFCQKCHVSIKTPSNFARHLYEWKTTRNIYSTRKCNGAFGLSDFPLVFVKEEDSFDGELCLFSRIPLAVVELLHCDGVLNHKHQLTRYTYRICRFCQTRVFSIKTPSHSIGKLRKWKTSPCCYFTIKTFFG